MVLVFASNNAYKLEEVRRIMPEGIEVLSLKDIGFEAEIEETGTTLEENSAIKAEAVYHWILDNGHLTLDGVFADDTGLEIDALGGKPGVYTARWYKLTNEGMKELTNEGMKELTNERDIFAANRAKALRELEGIEDRGAQFKTVITLITNERMNELGNERMNELGSERMNELGNERMNELGNERMNELGNERVVQVEGIVRGRIAKEEYGNGGFGYDPVFIPEGYDKTFGELPAEIKNSISHRARALAKLVTILA